MELQWKSVSKEKGTETYILRIKSNPSEVQGILHLKVQEGMLIMNLVEIALHNIGRKKKQCDYVAGCLIAFACRESFKLETNYKGFVSFESKTKLIDWYMEHYYAQRIGDQKMFIDEIGGQKLIDTYLNRTKTDNHDEK